MGIVTEAAMISHLKEPYKCDITHTSRHVDKEEICNCRMGKVSKLLGLSVGIVTEAVMISHQKKPLK